MSDYESESNSSKKQPTTPRVTSDLQLIDQIEKMVGILTEIETERKEHQAIVKKCTGKEKIVKNKIKETLRKGINGKPQKKVKFGTVTVSLKTVSRQKSLPKSEWEERLKSLLEEHEIEESKVDRITDRIIENLSRGGDLSEIENCVIKDTSKPKKGKKE